MPYCPKCDMEFIDGITVCSDCGGTLVESKEAYEAEKKKEQEAARLARAEREAAMEEGALDPAAPYGDLSAVEASMKEKSQAPRPHVYVKKAQQYEDLKSSSTAFLLVGGGLLIFSVLCWAHVIPLPLAGISGIISKSVMTVLGLAGLYVAWTSFQSAKKVAGQVAEEEEATRQLVGWFVASYTGDGLDRQIIGECGDLAPEELALKRYELIQDLIITNHDIADQDYVDALAEEIYGKLYTD